MEFGVAFTSRIGDYDLVALAESLGFDQAWFFDSQMIYSDVYATMAVAARATKRIRLATGMVGDPDQVIARIKALEAAGLTHFAFQVTDDPVGQMRYFAETVINRYA